MTACFMAFLFVPLLGIFAVSINGQSLYPPEQIHIAIGWTPDRMVFNWLTFDYPMQTWSRLRIDTVSTFDSPNYQEIRGKEYLFTDPWDRSEINRTIHVAIATDLDASSKYYYQVGDFNYGLSSTYSFRTGVNALTLQTHSPVKYVIYGDLGVFHLSDVVPMLTSETLVDDNIDTLIHVGDLAYDMYDNDGTVGDYFMNMVQPISTNVPYMVCPGNHEKYANFSHYSQRYRGMPSNTGNVWTGSGETPNNWYYSWNEGLVHWIAISTEIYFNYPWMIEEQYDWLKQDLFEANQNRTDAPWVIVYGHKQIYCSDPYNDAPGGSAQVLRDGVVDSSTGNRVFGLEDVFHDYGVDFYLAGHQHNYERMYDVYKHETTQTTTNMPATTYLLIGAAGAKHGLNEFLPVQPVWSAVRLLAYGYSRFYVYNETHIEFQYVVADKELKPYLSDDNVYETVWYIQENHGPFASNYGRKMNVSDRNDNKHETVNLYEKHGYQLPKSIFEPDFRVPYVGNDKRDYFGFDGVHF